MYGMSGSRSSLPTRGARLSRRAHREKLNAAHGRGMFEQATVGADKVEGHAGRRREIEHSRIRRVDQNRTRPTVSTFALIYV